MRVLIFDDIATIEHHCGFYYPTASRASGTAAARKGRIWAPRLRFKEGYFPVPPADQQMTSATR